MCAAGVAFVLWYSLTLYISDLMQQKGRLMHAYLEKAYNFGFSRGGPRCPPRPRIWRPRPIRKHPKFSKAPLRGAEILFSQGRAKKLARTRKKMGSNLGSNPGVQVPEFACLTPCMPASRTPCLARPPSMARYSLTSRQRPLTSRPACRLSAVPQNKGFHTKNMGVFWKPAPTIDVDHFFNGNRF